MLYWIFTFFTRTYFFSCSQKERQMDLLFPDAIGLKYGQKHALVAKSATCLKCKPILDAGGGGHRRFRRFRKKRRAAYVFRTVAEQWRPLVQIRVKYFASRVTLILRRNKRFNERACNRNFLALNHQK